VDKKDDRLVLTKIDAARRQLQTAIELFVVGNDPVSIHTLAMASNEILNTLCEKNGKKTFLMGSIRELAVDADAVKVLIKHLTQARNYFKHADRDADKEMKFAAELNDIIIFDSVQSYQALTGEPHMIFGVFRMWFMIEYSRFFDFSKSKELFQIHSGVVENFSKLPRNLFFKEALAVITEARVWKS